MRNVEVISPQNVVIRYTLASPGVRISAYLIDMLFISILSILLFFLVIIPFTNLDNDSFTLVLVFAAFFLAGFYHLLMETFNNGQSIGKQAMSIRVTDENGSTPGFMQLFMRWLLRIVDISISSGGIAILAIAYNDKAQRLGDVLGRTIVIDLHVPEADSLANWKPRAAKSEGADKASEGRLENNLREDGEAEKHDGAPKHSESFPLIYPEVEHLSEADIRKVDALYRKLKNGNYDIEVKRRLLTRVKIALEKKMGTTSQEETVTAFLKQVYADFHTHQKEQESRDGW
jgi:uncharacterized RDD family membrane protein YckC